MENKTYCFFCDKDVIPKKDKETNTYIIHKQKVEVKEETLICPNCHNELINDNLDNSLYLIYNEYLKLNGLSFKKFKEIRQYYNLSQELFATALNWSKKTVTRYENAQSMPQNQYLSIYKRIQNNKNEFLNILESNKPKINDKTYFKIYNLVNFEFDLKTINTILYILNDNALTKTQIMKNMFAVDFEAYKEIQNPITSIDYAHGTYGPIIDKKDAYLNFLIKQNYIEIKNTEDDNILFKPIKKCDLKLFSDKEIDIMNKVKQKLKGKSAKELTEWSHKFKGWIETKNGQKIDYKYAKDFNLLEGWE